MLKKTMLGLIMVGLVAIPSWAVPSLLNFQGRLTDSKTGKPVTSLQNMAFKLYDQERGGAVIWEPSSTLTVQPDSNGVFNVILEGTTKNPFPDLIGDKYYVAVDLGAGEMRPRQRLTTVPFAFKAFVAEELIPGKDYTVSGNLTVTKGVNVSLGVNVGNQAGAVSGQVKANKIYAKEYQNLPSTLIQDLQSVTDQGNSTAKPLIIDSDGNETTHIKGQLEVGKSMKVRGGISVGTRTMAGNGEIKAEKISAVEYVNLPSETLQTVTERGAVTDKNLLMRNSAPELKFSDSDASSSYKKINFKTEDGKWGIESNGKWLMSGDFPNDSLTVGANLKLRGHLSLDPGTLGERTIGMATSSGSDKAVLQLTGSGAFQSARGAALALYGINHSTRPGDLRFWTGNSKGNFIFNNGKVGIGTENPRAKLTVVGTGGGTALDVRNGGFKISSKSIKVRTTGGRLTEVQDVTINEPSGLIIINYLYHTGKTKVTVKNSYVTDNSLVFVTVQKSSNLNNVRLANKTKGKFDIWYNSKGENTVIGEIAFLVIN